MASAHPVRLALRTLLVAACGLAGLAAVTAQTPPGLADIGKPFEAPRGDYDYDRREVMIPMRDGVKLFTVIVVPKGAKRRADPADADAVQRGAAHRARRVGTHARRHSRRATTSSSPTATSASSRTCAASTDPKAST